MASHGIALNFDGVGVMHNAVADSIRQRRLTNFNVPARNI